MRALSALPAAAFGLAMLPLAGCEVVPNYVENGDIDDAMAREHFKTVCKGLEMKDAKTRTYATGKLKEITDPIAQQCVCAHIGSGKDGWDAAIAEGLTGTDRDELASCFADLVVTGDIQKREEAIVALARIPADASREAMGAVATDTTASPEVRIRALKGIAGDKRFTEQLLALLAGDADAAVRAAAATGLSGIPDEAVISALVTAYESDEDGAARGEALISLKKSGHPKADEMVCKAMMDDPSPDVRTRAIGAFRGTKRVEAVACLRARALTFEENGAVREQLLKVLKSSPKQEAADVLCDAIPFFMRSYVKEALPTRIPGTDIIKVQNDRDWERSYACLQKAYNARGGYACPAQMYVGHWFREVGGTAYVPKCPGIEQ
jgi:hypothetical protein